MKFKKFPVIMMSTLAVMFVSLANLMTTNSSIVLWGETKCPKDLLK